MGKAQSSFIRVEPFADLFCLLALYSHLTQPGGLAPLHLGTGSMSFYGNAAGTAV